MAALNLPLPSAKLAAPEPLDAYLPATNTIVLTKHSTVYTQIPDRLYWIIEGRVSVARILPKGIRVNLGVFSTGSLFGESSLSESCPLDEVAQALERTTLMAYTPEQFRTLLATRAGLANAFAHHVLLPRQADFARRIAEFRYGVKDRLALALWRIAEDHGASAQDSGFTLPAMSHEFLAAEINTGREMVTQHMNAMRRAGVLQYDRKGIYLSVAPLLAIANREAA